MNQPERRRLLKLAAALPASLPVLGFALADGRARFSYHLVKNQVTGDGVRAGALVLVDAGTGRFAGDGHYLYPDWGTPVVYEVKASGDALEFRYPGTGIVLWRISAGHADARFSGRVEGVIAAGDERAVTAALQKTGPVPVLEVPERPVA